MASGRVPSGNRVSEATRPDPSVVVVNRDVVERDVVGTVNLDTRLEQSYALRAELLLHIECPENEIAVRIWNRIDLLVGDDRSPELLRSNPVILAIVSVPCIWSVVKSVPPTEVVCLVTSLSQ